MTPASSGRDTQAPEVHFQAEENVQLEISSVNRSKLSLQTYNSETGAPNRCLAVIKEESIGGLQPKRCSPSHCVEEMCPLVNVTESTDISYKHSGECIYSKSTGGTDRFQSFECIPRNEPKSSLKEIAKLTTTVVSTSNHSPVSGECAEEHHLVCQELQSPKTRKPHQMKPSDVQKPNSHEGITIPVKVSSTRKCDEQTCSNTHTSRQHPDMSMEKTFGEKPNNVHVSDIVSTSSYSGKCVASHIRNTQAEGCRNLNKTEITIPAKSLSGRPAKNSMARHNFLFKFWKKLSNEKETIVDKSISNKWSDKPNSGSLKQQNPSISSTLSKVKPVVKFKRTFQTVKPEIVTDNDSNSKEGLSKPFRTVEIRPGSFLPPKIQFSQFDTKSNLVSEKEPSIYQNYDQVSLPDCLSVDTNSEAQDQNKKRKSSLSAETHQIQPDCLLQSDLNWCPGYKKQRSSGEESSVPGLKQTFFSDSAEDLAMDSCSDYIPNRSRHSHLLSNCDSWHSVGDTCGSLSTLPQDDGVVVHGKDLLNNKPLSKSEPDVKNSGSEEDSAPMLENRGSELYDPFDLDDRSLSPSPPGCSADPDSNMTSCKTPWIPTPKSVTEVKEEIAPKLDFLFTAGLNYNSTKLLNYQGSPQTKSDSVYEDARTLKENNRDSVDLGQISSLLHKDPNDEKHRMVREINVFNYRPGNMHTAPYCATRVADPVLSQEEKKNRESKGSHVKSKRTSRWGKPLFEDPVPLNLKEGTKKKPSTLCVKRLKKVDPVGKSTDTSWSVSTRASEETCCTAISIKTHPESVMLSNKDVVLTHGDMTNLYLDEVKASSREMKATATVEVLCDRYSSVSSQKFPSSDYDRRAVLSNPVTLNSLSGKRTVSSTKVVQLRGKVFKTPTRTACLLPASVSSSSGILPAAGGILIPDDSVYLESSPDNLERILNHLKKQQERGCDLTVKVHSQQICKLATKRRIFKEGSSANAQASGVLRLLTQFIKEGVVDLLQQHSCDSSQFLSAEESVACACDLHKKHCSVDQATVLLSKSGDDKLQQMGHEYGLRTATIGELLGICGD
ncbi:uncharacterized protein LOC135471975 [Liolophura sinensis]|uniref:uncharacterized protein LOC135471975 n=1 Tax=Liolophura sinensis TaxID=3198878 RepID=UPI0031592ED4